MFIYIDEFHKNLNKPKKIMNITYVKNTINYLKHKNNNIINLPDKIIYFILYLIKNDCKFLIINNIIYNKLIFKKISHNISVITFNIITYKWFNIINISHTNKVTSQLLDYFLNLYEIYLTKENCNKLYIVQAKSILGIHIKNKRQLYKYFNLNLYHSLYYIDIIFTKINKKYLSINYIFSIS